MSDEENKEVDIENETFKAEMSRLAGDGDAPLEQEEQVEAEEESSQEVEVTEQETEKDESKNELLQQISKLQKALDTTNGTYGQKLADMQRRLDELTQQRQNDPEVERQPVDVELSEDDFEELKAEFPELAPMAAKGVKRALQKVLQNIGRGGQFNQEDVSRFIQGRIDDNRQQIADEIKREMHLEILTEKHPDWKDVAGIDTSTGVVRWNDMAFGNWVATQPHDVQDSIINSNNAYELSKHISNYKNSLKSKKQNNLEKAIQPKGVSTQRSYSGDPEERAYIEEMKRLNALNQ